MLDWLLGLLPHALTVVLLVAAFFLPGPLVLLPLKPGLPAAIALSPAVTLLIFLAGSMVADAVGVPWSAATAVLAAVPPVLAAWLIGEAVQFSAPLWPAGPGLPAKVAVGAGVAIGSIVTRLALLRGIGDPAKASQGWDPIFHLNVLRWIQESGTPRRGAWLRYLAPAGPRITPRAGTARCRLSRAHDGNGQPVRDRHRRHDLANWPDVSGLGGPAAASCGLGTDAAVRGLVRQLSVLPAAPQRPVAHGSPLPVPATVAVGVLILRHLTSAERVGTPVRERVTPGRCPGRSPGRLCCRAPERHFCLRRCRPPLRGSRACCRSWCGAYAAAPGLRSRRLWLRLLPRWWSSLRWPAPACSPG